MSELVYWIGVPFALIFWLWLLRNLPDTPILTRSLVIVVATMIWPLSFPILMILIGFSWLMDE